MFFYGERQLLSSGQVQLILLSIGLLLAGQALMRKSSLELVFAKIPVSMRILLLASALLTLSLHTGGDRAFIYFQF